MPLVKSEFAAVSDAMSCDVVGEMNETERSALYKRKLGVPGPDDGLAPASMYGFEQPPLPPPHQQQHQQPQQQPQPSSRPALTSRQIPTFLSSSGSSTSTPTPPPPPPPAPQQQHAPPQQQHAPPHQQHAPPVQQQTTNSLGKTQQHMQQSAQQQSGAHQLQTQQQSQQQQQNQQNDLPFPFTYSPGYFPSYTTPFPLLSPPVYLPHQQQAPLPLDSMPAERPGRSVTRQQVPPPPAPSHHPQHHHHQQLHLQSHSSTSLESASSNSSLFTGYSPSQYGPPMPAAPTFSPSFYNPGNGMYPPPHPPTWAASPPVVGPFSHHVPSSSTLSLIRTPDISFPSSDLFRPPLALDRIPSIGEDPPRQTKRAKESTSSTKQVAERKRQRKARVRTRKDNGEDDGEEFEGNGENRLMIIFDNYGTLDETHLPRIGKKGFVPGGLAGSFTMYSERWTFRIDYAGTERCDDSNVRMKVKWSIRNSNWTEWVSMIETAKDALRRETRGFTMCNKVFLLAMQRRAQEYEELAQNERVSAQPNANQLSNYENRAQYLRPQKVSEGPLLFGLRHKVVQDMYKSLVRGPTGNAGAFSGGESTGGNNSVAPDTEDAAFADYQAATGYGQMVYPPSRPDNQPV